MITPAIRRARESSGSGLPSLERMAAYVAVAESGSFTAAADRLDSSKSALSQSVTALERELGVQLIQRTTRRLTVTDAGLVFLDDCRALLAKALEVVELARGGKAQPAGTLRLTSPADSALQVAQWIARYRRLYPQVRVEYHPTDRTLDIVEGRFDLALRLGIMKDSRLHGVKLHDVDVLLVAAPAYLAERGTPSTPRQMASHEWLALSVVPSSWTLPLMSASGKLSHLRMKGSTMVGSASGQRALALAGAGVAAIPATIVQSDLESGRLVRLLGRYRLPRISFYAVYSGTIGPAPKTRAFIDLIQESSPQPSSLQPMRNTPE